MTPLTELFILPLEQLYGIGTVGQVTSSALPFLKGLMGGGIALILFLVARETGGGQIGREETRGV
jgi:hypothetical protein